MAAPQDCRKHRTWLLVNWKGRAHRSACALEARRASGGATDTVSILKDLQVTVYTGNVFLALQKRIQAAHQSIVEQPQDRQRYSKFPVHELEFWTKLFSLSKSPVTAQQVLDEIGEIENEPCIENELVFRNVQQALSFARLALLN